MGTPENPIDVKKQSGGATFGCLICILALIVFVVVVNIVGRLYKDDSVTSSPTASMGKLDPSDPQRLNVSAPTFSSSGIRFTLNDARANSSLWVTIKIGRTVADKDILSWISTYGEKPGPVFVSFQSCKYLDAGIDALTSATECQVIIGAKLKDADKVVYTSFDTPISEFRRALLSAAK